MGLGMKNKHIRILVLTAFVALTLNWSLQHLSGISTFLCHYCPESVLQASVLLLSGEVVAKINAGNIAVLLALTVTTLAFGRGFCGWICPFGAIFEYLNLIRAKLNIIWNPPENVDSTLKYLKYIIFIGLILITAGVGEYIFRDFCPARALYLLERPESGALFPLLILGIILIGGIIVPRFFCRYLCPLGAYTAVIARISPTSVKLNSDLCIICGKCKKACQLGIDPVVKIPKTECTNCLDCIEECPADALEVKL
jgi:polyferredoxin